MGLDSSTTQGARKAATIDIVITIGQRHPLTIPRSTFNEVTTNVNLFIRVREKLVRTVTPSGRLESNMLKSLNRIRLYRISVARTKIGMVHLYTTVGLTTTFIDMKKMEVNRLPIGRMTRVTLLVPLALVSRDFTMNVFSVVENFVPAVTTITFRYSFREAANSTLPSTKWPNSPRRAGTRQTFNVD